MKKKYVKPEITTVVVEEKEPVMIIISGHVNDPSESDAKSSDTFEEDLDDFKIPVQKDIWSDETEED